MSKSSLEELTMDRRGYHLPPLRAPYDTDFNYTYNNNNNININNNRHSLQSLPPSVSHFPSQNSERMDRLSEERQSTEYKQTTNDRLFMEELLRRQQRWVMGLMENSFRRITEDVVRTTNLVRRHEQVIHELNSSHTKLDKYYGAVVQDLTSRSTNCDKRIKEMCEDIKQNKDTIEKTIQNEARDKKEIEDHIMKNNAEYINELSKVRAEIEGLRTSYKKDIAVADERRRIEMDDARSRIQALDVYTKNALHTLKNAVQEALGRSENKISDSLKEERMVWRQNMDSTQKHTKEQMERLDQSISIIEEESMRLINAVTKKLESVQDVVTTEKSTNEEFRKVMKNYMDTGKNSSEKSGEEMKTIKEETATKMDEMGKSIESLRSLIEDKYKTVVDQVKEENEELDRQIQQLSRQSQTLQQQILSSNPSPVHTSMGPSHGSGGPSPTSVGPSHASGGPSHASRGPSHASVVPSHASGVPSNGSRVPSHASVVPSSHASGVPSNGSRAPSNGSRAPSHASGVPSHASGRPSHA